VRGGHCLVNFPLCTRTKHLGALRLIWLWYDLGHQDRLWKHLLKVSDPGDRQLFFCSTVVDVGDGKDIPFWEARWLDGIAPKEQASKLFQVARLKTRSVYSELQNNNWIRNLKNITTFAHME
jgi:hypothetical protein